MRYQLIQIEDNGAVITHEFTAITLSDMLTRFRYFLQGCSFVIDVGEEVIVDQSDKYDPGISIGKKVLKKTK